MNHWSYLSWTLQGMPPITSSSTMCNFLLHFSSYSVELNPIFTAYTFSPIFPNFPSSLPQMEPMPSQVTNHSSQMKVEVHHERALAFKKVANRRCPSNVSLPIIFHHGFCYGWLMTLISLFKQDDNTNQEIGDDDKENHTELTAWFNMKEDDLDHNRRFCCFARRAWTRLHEIQKFHCERNGAVLILSLYALHHQIPEMQVGQWHQHCSNAKSQPSSTYYPSLTVHYPPRHCPYVSEVQTRIFHNPKPVEMNLNHGTWYIRKN